MTSLQELSLSRSCTQIDEVTLQQIANILSLTSLDLYVSGIPSIEQLFVTANLLMRLVDEHSPSLVVFLNHDYRHIQPSTLRIFHLENRSDSEEDDEDSEEDGGEHGSDQFQQPSSISPSRRDREGTLLGYYY